MRFLSLLLVVACSGCCSVVSKSGDARIVKCPQLIHERGSKSYRIVLPPVSLAEASTNVLRVRNVPPYLAGLFKFDLSMPVPYDETFPRTELPWKDAKIVVLFLGLGGAELGRYPLDMGTAAHGFSQSREGWQAGWNLAGEIDWPSSPPGQSYDIVIIVERPSKRPSDRVSLTGYAFTHTGPNERPGADAGWRVLFALGRPRPRAAQAERYAADVT